jgi:hypothetical protein
LIQPIIRTYAHSPSPEAEADNGLGDLNSIYAEIFRATPSPIDDAHILANDCRIKSSPIPQDDDAQTLADDFRIMPCPLPQDGDAQISASDDELDLIRNWDRRILVSIH